MEKNRDGFMNTFNFDSLVTQIQATNDVLQGNARLVINRHVTAKAWLTGYYIVEYEQHGEDRAKYGERLPECHFERLGKKDFGITTLKDVFVSKYELNIPSKERMTEFLRKENEGLNDKGEV